MSLADFKNYKSEKIPKFKIRKENKRNDKIFWSKK